VEQEIGVRLEGLIGQGRDRGGAGPLDRRVARGAAELGEARLAGGDVAAVRATTSSLISGAAAKRRLAMPMSLA
jgi:hypothetical protein